MKTLQRLAVLSMAALFLLGGCSMGKDEDTNTPNNLSKANETKTNQPQNQNTGSDTMDRMIAYLNQQGVTMDQMKSLDQMDFAAHEGRSFSYQGNTGYLYRLKSEDESMKALLESAQKNGTVKVNRDGQEQNYNAAVNGDYLFVYDPNVDMKGFIDIFSGYMPNISVSPKTSDEESLRNESQRSENGNANPINGNNASEFNDAAQPDQKVKNDTINGSNSTTNNNTANGINEEED